MKKLLLIIISLTLLSFTSALDINLANSLRLSENEGIVNLPTITINLDNQTTNFSLVLGEFDYIIFQGSENITINNSSVETKLSLDNKKLEFDGNFSGVLIINGVQIRSYDERIDGSKLGLDLGNNGTIDCYSTNVIEQDQDGRYEDDMVPLSITNAKYTLSGQNIILTRNPSPDLDLVNTTIEIYKNNGYLRYFTVGAKDTTTTITELDLSKDNIKIDISAKDIYYRSDIVSIEIPKQETPVETTSISKYNYQITSPVLGYIVDKLDKNITTYSTWNDGIMNKRNSFVDFLEKFLKKTITVPQFLAQAKNHTDMLNIFKK